MRTKYELIKETDFNRIKKEIKKKQNEKKEVVFSSDDDNLNRKVLEKQEINILLLNQSQRNDKAKQKDSGLNQVMARLAKKNNITIGINLEEIISANTGGARAKILARVIQNIKLCKKYKLKMKFISEKGNSRNPYDLKALGLVLGMPTWMTRLLDSANLNNQ